MLLSGIRVRSFRVLSSVFRWGTKSDVFLEVHGGGDVCMTGPSLIPETLGCRTMPVVQGSKQGISRGGAG